MSLFLNFDPQTGLSIEPIPNGGDECDNLSEFARYMAECYYAASCIFPGSAVALDVLNDGEAIGPCGHMLRELNELEAFIKRYDLARGRQ